MSSRNLAYIYVWHRARVDSWIIRVDPYRESEKNKNWVFGAEVLESTRTWIRSTCTKKSSKLISGITWSSRLVKVQVDPCRKSQWAKIWDLHGLVDPNYSSRSSSRPDDNSSRLEVEAVASNGSFFKRFQTVKDAKWGVTASFDWRSIYTSLHLQKNNFYTTFKEKEIRVQASACYSNNYFKRASTRKGVKASTLIK